MPTKAFECEHCGHAELLVGNVAKNIPRNMIGFPCPACGKKQTGDGVRKRVEKESDANHLLESLFVVATRLGKAGADLEASATRIDDASKKLDSMLQAMSTILKHLETTSASQKPLSYRR